MGELNDILQSLEPSLGPLGGPPVPLEGGITNRNFRARLGPDEYVVRLYGRDTGLLGISRSAERIANEAAAQLGIAPPVIAEFAGGLVTRFVPCTPMHDREIRQRVAEIARALRSFHDSPTVLPVEFRVQCLLDEYARLVRAQGGGLTAAYGLAVQLAARIELALPDRPMRPCHNDLLAANLLRARSDARTMIVDWEYAGMGHCCFDLGNLSVNNDFDDATDLLLLGAYHGCRPSSSQVAELKLMRVLSDAREGAWGVVQANVSQIDFDFEGYAALHFARMQSAAHERDFGEWLAAAEGSAHDQGP